MQYCYHVNGIRADKYYMKKFTINVNNQTDASQEELCVEVNRQEAPFEEILNYTCIQPQIGRYVIIRKMDGQLLTVCEVQVFAGPPYKSNDIYGRTTVL